MIVVSLSLNILSNRTIKILSNKINQLATSQERSDISFSTLVSDYSVQAFKMNPEDKDNMGAFVRISGILNYDMKKQFISVVNQTMEKGYQIKAIHIQNVDGGFIKVGSFIGQFVANNNIKVIVSGRCYSSCNLIFMFAQNRIADYNSEFGFHGYNDSPEAKEAVENIIRNYLTTTLNIKDKELIDKMFINKKDVNIIHVTKLREIGYVTQIIDNKISNNNEKRSNN